MILKAVNIIILLVLSMQTYSQNPSVSTIDGRTFLIDNDSIISKISDLEVLNQSSKLKLYLYRLYYTMEGDEKRESVEIYYINDDSTAWIFNKEPFEKNDLGFENGKREAFVNSSEDLVELNQLMTLSGFFRQGSLRGDKEVYERNNITFMLFYQDDDPEFGYVKFGPVNLLPERTKLTRDQINTLINFHGQYF